MDSIFFEMGRRGFLEDFPAGVYYALDDALSARDAFINPID